jgi:hypothetical protein
MHHEEESLPGFVKGRGSDLKQPACRFKCFENEPISRTTTQKMETPVIYFYTQEETPVRVKVDFPKGIISQYFPAPVSFMPALGQAFGLFGGSVTFEGKVTPTPLDLPFVEPNSVYRPAREVASNYFQSGSENEKFIFYRGLGVFETDLRVTSVGNSLSLKNQGTERIESVFLLNTKVDGTGDIRAFAGISAGDSKRLSAQIVEELIEQAKPKVLYQERAQTVIVNALIASGLYPDESLAMFNTWKRSYLDTPGLRVLYVLSRGETDRILPISIQPQPTELVRILVGRIEILTDRQEGDLLSEVQDLFPKVSFPSEMGRLADPKLRRLMQIARKNQNDELVQQLSQLHAKAISE